MLGLDKNDVTLDPAATASRAAAEFAAVVALKGAATFIAAPEGGIYRYDGGHVGLATSGSGDALAGIIAGLAARGAEPLRAVLWGTALHGGAGNVLARRHGPIGFLARELLDEIPALMARLGRAGAARRVRAAAE
jgi:ADP-dependent NAD(P)H-hydrate dehydratase